MSLRVANHLGFGVRVEKVSMLLDGDRAFDVDATESSGAEGERVPVQPGVHALSITLWASEPCGLLEEPRASVAVHARTTFSVGERPAAILADVFARDATADPMDSVAVRFRGVDVVLGVPEEALRVPDGCPADDALCEVDAKAARARSRSDAVSASCYETRRGEARVLRDLLEDSYNVVTREGVTAGDAEKAQITARYARARSRSLTVEADSCVLAATPRVDLAIVEREIERSCPSPDVTALRRF